jgi:hypothetical protein
MVQVAHHANVASGRPFIGVVMLDTRFPRPLGDIGHPDTWGDAARHLVVERAWPAEVVASPEAVQALAPRFIDAVQTLAAQGAFAVTTSCGFLVLLQSVLQAAVDVPVLSSSLLRLPALLQAHPRVGVLTISDTALTPAHLLAAGVPPARLVDVCIQGIAPDSEFVRCILGNEPQMDLRQVEPEVVAAAQSLRARAPELHTLVLECTNLPPYARAIEAATGWRTWSLLDEPALRPALTSSAGAAR